MKVGRMWAVLKMQIRTFYREKSSLFFTFFFPVLLMILFGAIFQNTGDTIYTYYVQDQDNTPMSLNFTDTLGHIKNIKIIKINASKNAESVMKATDGNFLVIIPKGFNETLTAKMSYNPNATVNLTVKYDPSSTTASIKLSILNAVIQQYNKGLTGSKDTIFIEASSSITTKKFSYIEFFIPGIIAMTVMTGAVFGTIIDENEYKQKGIIRKLSTTPIMRSEWIFSVMMYQFIIAMLSSLLILGVGYLAFKATLFVNIVLPLIVIFETFGFVGLSMLLTRLVKDGQAAAAVSNVITFPMMFLSGTFIPVEQMPPFLQSVAKVMPLYYANESLRSAMILNDLVAALTKAVPLIIFAVVVFAIGILVTSWKQD